jgi:hypothetical protein
MNSDIENLLGQLETISAELTEMTEHSLSGADNLVEVLDLITGRGALVEKLSGDLAARSSPVSYSDWNRLVVIHHQGQRIGTNLSAKRNDILGQLAVNAQGQALLNRMNALVEEGPRTISSIDI